MDMNFDRKKAATAQEQYCDEHECPRFAPADGNCPRCGRNIYEPVKTKTGMVYGFSVEYAEQHLITGCPYCNATFVD